MKVQYHPNYIDPSGKLKEISKLQEVEFEELLRCPVCEEEAKLKDIAVLRESLISTFCGHCGHFFHRKRPSPEWISHWYLNNWDRAPEHYWNQKTKEARLVFNGLKNRFTGESVYNFVKEILSTKRKMRILEIGCGYGNQLLPFKLAGHEVCALEASKHRAQFVRRFGVRVENIPIEELTADTFGGEFDFVFSHHVMEHVGNPVEFIDSIVRVLKPKGWLGLFVPNIENESLLPSFFTAVHPHSFSRSSLQYLVNRRGFAIHRWREDNQLSVLACNEKNAEKITSVNPVLFSDADIFKDILGSDYASLRGQTYFCRWNIPTPRIRSIMNAEFSLHSQNGAFREISLRWNEEETLPLYFEKNEQAAPFWIK